MKAKDIKEGKTYAIATANFSGKYKPRRSYDATVIAVDPDTTDLMAVTPDRTTTVGHRITREVSYVEAIENHISREIERAGLGKGVLIRIAEDTPAQNHYGREDGNLQRGSYIAYFGDRYAVVPSKFVIGTVEEIEKRDAALKEATEKAREQRKAQARRNQERRDEADRLAERLVAAGGPAVRVEGPNVHGVTSVHLGVDKLEQIVEFIEQQNRDLGKPVPR